MKKTYLLIFVASLVLVALAFFFQDKLSHFRTLGLLGIFLINFFGSATIFLPAPAIVSVVAGGMIYPPILVALISALGGAFGDGLGFLLGHSSKEVFKLKKHKFLYPTLEDLFKKYGAIIIVVFAFIPNPLFDAIGILAGIFSFSPGRFFTFLFLGRLLRNIILVQFSSVIAGY
ncbi:MAG: VTT domain-containing protein [Candidatus Levyibacteriota bacterium]